MLEFKDRMWAMSIAMEEANKAYAIDEVPVGACLLDNNGKIIAKSHNTKERDQDPSGHAEMNCIRQLSQELNTWRLNDYHLIVTLEPCIMCMGGIIHARLSSLTFGAYDPKGGAFSLGLNIHKNPSLNHEVSVVGGIQQKKCGKILSDYFKEKRRSYKFKK